MSRLINLTGQVFGRLTVVSRAVNVTGKDAKWNCICECGNTSIAIGTSLRNKHTKSCGCLRYGNDFSTTHGGHNTTEYSSWNHMKQRCYNPKNHAFKRYGGRGITVCDRWKNSFENFICDMSKKPTPSHTIDRRNNNGNYAPDNCRWATKKEQGKNTISTRYITYKGQTLTHSEWGDILGGGTSLVHDRIKRGWSEKDAVSIPVHSVNNYRK